jgi:hypothetical protein
MGRKHKRHKRTRHKRHSLPISPRPKKLTKKRVSWWKIGGLLWAFLTSVCFPLYLQQQSNISTSYMISLQSTIIAQQQVIMAQANPSNSQYMSVAAMKTVGTNLTTTFNSVTLNLT